MLMPHPGGYMEQSSHLPSPTCAVFSCSSSSSSPSQTGTPTNQPGPVAAWPAGVQGHEGGISRYEGRMQGWGSPPLLSGSKHAH